MTDKNELEVSTGPSGQLHDAPMAIELAETFGLAPKQVINVLRTSIIKVPRNDPPPTPAELVVVMSVMRQLGANPMLKELHAWRDNKGELCCMPSYDLWAKKASEQPGYQGVTYEFGPECPSPDGKGRSAWEWCKVTVHDKERGDFAMFPTYLEEWYVPMRGQYPGPWQKQTRHKLHVISFRSAIREFYNLGGVDLRDPEDLVAGGYHEVAAEQVQDKIEVMAEAMGKTKEVVEPLDVTPIEDDADAWTCPLCKIENHAEVCVGCGVPYIPEDDIDPAEPLPAEKYKSPQGGFCASEGCNIAWSIRCGVCGKQFCSAHMGEDRVACLGCGGES